MLIVQKYGGSSVADAGRIRQVARRVAGARADGHRVVVVVSAMGDTTDELIQLVKEVTDSPPEREMDVILSTGEQVSIALLAMAIKDLGEPVISLTGAQVGILTDNVHTKAKILHVNTARLMDELNRGNIVVVAGFQGINSANDITTLGRGGSDTTAVALAAALKADLCEIYTDVDGVYTADPRLVPEARKLDVVSYEEMLELANLGAVVLHPRSVELAMQYGIPLHVRSSFNHNSGTVVKEAENMEKALVVTGVAYDMNVAKVGLYNVFDRPGIAYKLFKALADENINVDMIVQSAMRGDRNDISFTCTQGDLKKALQVVERLLPELGASGYTSDDSVAKVSIVGAGMVSNPGVAARMFEAIYEEGINLEMISTSEIKISCIIKAHEAGKAVKALHKKFNLAQEHDQ
ncbi:MAG: aspartate kinase [Pelotomaculum sp.]|uniref:Aspartokinase n=1 Tax=Pelotomaculum thermopropionicum (strain DSM 13744 / JCM 10971 / SI) TaxID=370438 RepID=A5D1T6_PELTS|nr:aspartate kinase [Pelotomaculum sp.]BAF59780.1 aspartokinases [Pelotomaculum thermopropionicum SI]